MSTAALVVLGATIVFGLLAPPCVRRVSPLVGTWLLSAGSALTAAACCTSAALIAVTLLTRFPELAEQGHLSPGALRRHDPVSVPLAALAAVAVVVAAAFGTRAAYRRFRALHSAAILARALPTHGSELAVIDTATIGAYAVPGRPGCIVATSGLLRRLDPAERRAVLAHERAHLAHRHHVHQTVVMVASAVIPVLRPLRRAIALSCERWADEEAAVNGRDVVARALVRAGVAGPCAALLPVVLPGVYDVASRIDAMRRPSPSASLWRVALVVLPLLLAVAAALAGCHSLEELLDSARRIHHGFDRS
jgi:peptidase M48-like protein